MARNKISAQKPTSQREEIQVCRHTLGQGVELYVGTGQEYNGKFVFDVPQRFEVVRIVGDDYDALMSDRPAFAPNKPAGTFRYEDLWHFVDRQRGVQ
jgi:hypothetical protein